MFRSFFQPCLTAFSLCASLALPSLAVEQASGVALKSNTASVLTTKKDIRSVISAVRPDAVFLPTSTSSAGTYFGLIGSADSVGIGSIRVVLGGPGNGTAAIRFGGEGAFSLLVTPNYSERSSVGATQKNASKVSLDLVPVLVSGQGIQLMGLVSRDGVDYFVDLFSAAPPASVASLAGEYTAVFTSADTLPLDANSSDVSEVVALMAKITVGGSGQVSVSGEFKDGQHFVQLGNVDSLGGWSFYLDTEGYSQYFSGRLIFGSEAQDGLVGAARYFIPEKKRGTLLLQAGTDLSLQALGARYVSSAGFNLPKASSDVVVSVSGSSAAPKTVTLTGFKPYPGTRATAVLQAPLGQLVLNLFDAQVTGKFTSPLIANSASYSLDGTVLQGLLAVGFVKQDGKIVGNFKTRPAMTPLVIVTPIGSPSSSVNPPAVTNTLDIYYRSTVSSGTTTGTTLPPQPTLPVTIQPSTAGGTTLPPQPTLPVTIQPSTAGGTTLPPQPTIDFYNRPTTSGETTPSGPTLPPQPTIDFYYRPTTSGGTTSGEPTGPSQPTLDFYFQPTTSK